MSKQADRVLRDLLEDQEAGMNWPFVVEEIRSRCGVQENTAKQYIRRSDEAVVEQTMDGDKVVKSPGNAGETVVHDEDKVIEMEVGEPTGETYGNLEVLEDVGHPEVPEEYESGYIKRRMDLSDDQQGASGGMALSRKTDVHVVTSTMADDDFSTLVIGKHGVGKDALILHCCANTNRPTIRLVANDDPDFVDLLIGTYAPDENGDFTRKKGLLQIAIENGYTFILDEFNTLSGKVQTMLNKILEDADKSELVIPETNETIEPHPQFKFVATQNPNEVGYGGREDLDYATSSRFYPVQLPPLGTEGEKRVIANETEWDSDAPELEKLLGDNGIISGLRTLHRMGKLSLWVSTRDVIQIARMAHRLNSVKAAAEMVLIGRADPENKDTIRDNINDKVW